MRNNVERNFSAFGQRVTTLLLVPFPADGTLPQLSSPLAGTAHTLGVVSGCPVRVQVLGTT